MIILPRNDHQKEMIKNKWARQLSSGRIIAPEQVVDGLNLLWNSDLVISGGGTMNREAAALGIPVYSIFRGKIGAVDHYLSEKGKLVLLEKPEDIRKKLVIKKRQQTAGQEYGNNVALKSVVGHILKILAKK
jgi:predicted glycosyltransferase